MEQPRVINPVFIIFIIDNLWEEIATQGLKMYVLMLSLCIPVFSLCRIRNVLKYSRQNRIFVLDVHI